ncbi:MAG: hypothetical protein RIC56_03765 [Pseudomonadales bacterium]
MSADKGRTLTDVGMSRDQQAMAVARIYPETTEKGGRGNKAFRDETLSRGLISKARTVLHHAPDLADTVLARGFGI